MAFFNKKEEVIDLILTRVGREKLAVGRFKPTHYDFFDDDIIYDMKTMSGSVDVTELQNDILSRIKTMPTLKSQAGLKYTKKYGPAFGSDAPSYGAAPSLFKSLGRSSVFDEKKPAWDIQALEGSISKDVSQTPLEFTEDVSDAVGAFSQEKIPQLDIVCKYSFTAITNKAGASQQLWLNKTSDDILLDIFEKNTEDTNDNFTIEVFKYKKNASGEITDAVPLKFSTEEFNNETVEYFFDITTDDEAENTIDIKYVDQPIEKVIEVDKCVDELESSCAREKIDQLQIELRKHKLKSETLAGQLKKYAKQISTGKCTDAGDCVEGEICVGVKYSSDVVLTEDGVAAKQKISGYGNCVDKSEFTKSAAVELATKQYYGEQKSKCSAAAILAPILNAKDFFLQLIGQIIKNGADLVATKDQCYDLNPMVKKAIDAMDDQPEATKKAMKMMVDNMTLKGEWTGDE